MSRRLLLTLLAAACVALPSMEASAQDEERYYRPVEDPLLFAAIRPSGPFAATCADPHDIWSFRDVLDRRNPAETDEWLLSGRCFPLMEGDMVQVLGVRLDQAAYHVVVMSPGPLDCCMDLETQIMADDLRNSKHDGTHMVTLWQQLTD